MPGRIGALILAVVLAACDASVTTSATPSIAPPVEPTASTNGDSLFGAIVDFDRATRSVKVDLAQFLGGDEAIAAAREDGVIGPTQDLPNPFYVRDLKEQRTLAVAADAAVVVLGYDAEGGTQMTPISLEEFASFWRHGPASGAWTDALYYWFSPSDGSVDRIEAQYIP